MDDLQVKFALALVLLGLFFAYVSPMVKQVQEIQDAAIGQVGGVYVAPNPNDRNAPSGQVALDELQKYADKKAAERRPRGCSRQTGSYARAQTSFTTLRAALW
jgi:hypothetical protein